MPTKRPTRPKQGKATARRAPRPNNPYGIDNEEFDRLSLESSRKYAGKWIAWAPGHDKVVAVGDTFGEAADEAERLGHDVQTLIYQSPPPDAYLYKS